MTKPELLKIRAQLFSAIREFFAMRGFTEVDTPALVPLPSQEPYLSPIEAKFQNVHGQPLNWYLTTSPEFAIKKLLAQGARNVYQMSHVFRGGEFFGGTHNPEFMMLEWYRTPGDYNDIMRDTEELICFIIEHLKTIPPLRLRGDEGALRESVMLERSDSIHVDPIGLKASRMTNPHSTPTTPFARLTVTEAFKQFANLETANFTEQNWIDTAKKFGHNVNTADDAFFVLFLNEVENKLPQEQPIFIKDYPLFQASLAKISDKNPQVSERFELYWHGLELANAFSELVDAKAQEARFKKDQDIKRSLNKPVIPIDQEFLTALKKGFPPTGGIALGVDRLLMILTGAKDINEVLPSSIKNLN